MKKLILGTAALALSAGLAWADTVRMGTEGAYPPYNFINDAGEVDGFERELGDELCKRAGLTCEWVKNDWDSIIPNLVSGNYDTIIAGMSITPERDEVIDFTQDYYPPTASAYAATSGDVDVNSGVVMGACTVMNLDRWNTLPESVRKIILDTGVEWGEKVQARAVMEREHRYIDELVRELGRKTDGFTPSPGAPAWSRGERTDRLRSRA